MNHANIRRIIYGTNETEETWNRTGKTLKGNAICGVFFSEEIPTVLFTILAKTYPKVPQVLHCFLPNVPAPNL